MAEAMDIDQTQFQRAQELEKSNPSESIKIYQSLVFAPVSEDESEDEVKQRENAIYGLAKMYMNKAQIKDLVQLTKDIRPVFVNFPKAKTAKVVRSLIDMVHRMRQPDETLVDLCNDCIEWAKSQKRTFLRQRVETRLCSVYSDLGKYEPAMKMLGELVKDVKMLDDKLLLVEIFLIDTRVNFQCENLAKAKAALTAAKTNANAIHCPPLLQAEIDLWSGVLALREKDPRTAFSYLYEAFESFNVNKDESTFHAQDYNFSMALQALRCQLLTKIMQDQPGACRSLVQSKNMLKYQTHESVQAILKIAGAYEERSLKKLEEVLAKYPVNDAVIEYHLKDLYDTFLEKNLIKILEPFSHVEIAHVAELIELSVPKTLQKLSNMILDNKLLGTLDQGNGILLLFPEEPTRAAYGDVMGVIKNSAQCVDSLGKLTQKLHD